MARVFFYITCGLTARGPPSRHPRWVIGTRLLGVKKKAPD